MQTVPNPSLGTVQIEDDRTGLTIETLKRAFLDNLFYIQGKFPARQQPNDYYMGAGVYRARSPAATLAQFGWTVY